MAGASLKLLWSQEVDCYTFIAILSVNKEGIWMQVCLIHLTHPPCSLVIWSNLYTGKFKSGDPLFLLVLPLLKCVFINRKFYQ